MDFKTKKIPINNPAQTISRLSLPLGQIETPQFKQWFADSKIVDPSGKPLKTYHGTVNDFHEFSKKRVKPNFTSPQKHLGFFFTDDPSYAVRYAKRNGDTTQAQIIPVYLSIRNPKYEPMALIDEIEEEWRQYDATHYVRNLIAQGHDGIVFAGQTKLGFIQEFVAFRPEQIKSALGNSGNFDSQDARLTA